MHKKSWTVSNSEQEHRSRPLSYTHLQQNAAYVVIQIVEFLVKLLSRALTKQEGLKYLLGCMYFFNSCLSPDVFSSAEFLFSTKS